MAAYLQASSAARSSGSGSAVVGSEPTRASEAEGGGGTVLSEEGWEVGD